MARFRIRILTAKLFKLQVTIRELLRDFRPVWKEQAPIVRTEIVDAFLAAIHHPITKATRIWRRRHGYPENNPPLQASGRMLASLRGGPGSVELQQAKQLVMGTNLPQAAPNQFGATINVRRKSERQKSSGKGRKSSQILYRISIPARPFILEGSSETLTQKLSTQMQNFLSRLFVQKMSESPKKPES